MTKKFTDLQEVCDETRRLQRAGQWTYEKYVAFYDEAESLMKGWPDSIAAEASSFLHEATPLEWQRRFHDELARAGKLKPYK